MRRHVLLVLVGLVLATPAPAAPARERSWAQAEIKLVTSRGLLGGDPASFRPNDPLTDGELAGLVAGLTGRDAPIAADPSAPVTVARLDAHLVRALGLADAARQFSSGLRAAGLEPPSISGTEVVARLLGLRKNHKDDALELLPIEPATRAETAYSAAKILRFAGGEVAYVRQLAGAFAPPLLSGLRREIARTAVGLIGYPYVWGGTSGSPQELFGKQTNGGFDCSGFVWRVYKLQAYAAGETVGTTIQGRTTYELSGEVAPGQRIRLAQIEPADVLFFGPRGPKSKPDEITHMGIYLGGGWFIQSSEQGVALAPISGWYEPRFAWARRPLTEAGLA